MAGAPQTLPGPGFPARQETRSNQAKTRQKSLRSVKCRTKGGVGGGAQGWRVHLAGTRPWIAPQQCQRPKNKNKKLIQDHRGASLLPSCFGMSCFACKRRKSDSSSRSFHFFTPPLSKIPGVPRVPGGQLGSPAPQPASVDASHHHQGSLRSTGRPPGPRPAWLSGSAAPGSLGCQATCVSARSSL